MMMRLLLFLFLLVSIGCKRLPDVQGNGAAALQGVWQQDSLPGSAQLRNYTLHNFKFTCDSFYVTLATTAKVNYYPDSCFNNGRWKEYATGTYTVHDDTLILNGKYSKEDHKLKVQGCFNIGPYIQNFIIRNTEKQALILENIGTGINCNLQLQAPVTCNPKAL